MPRGACNGFETNSAHLPDASVGHSTTSITLLALWPAPEPKSKGIVDISVLLARGEYSGWPRPSLKSRVRLPSRNCTARLVMKIMRLHMVTTALQGNAGPQRERVALERKYSTQRIAMIRVTGVTSCQLVLVSIGYLCGRERLQTV